MIKKNSERRIGSRRICHGVKFSINPRRETIAIEKPKLSAILSILSIPLFSFFVGKSAKISVYPGMKRRKGNPNIDRMILFIESNTIGGNIIAQAIHRMISIGYFVNIILMALLYIFAILNILYKINTKKIKKNKKIENCNLFLSRSGKDSDMNSLMISNPITIKIKMKSKLTFVSVVITYTAIVNKIIINIMKESVKRLVVISPVFIKMRKNPINIIVILIFTKRRLGKHRRKIPIVINIIAMMRG
jgi:hypothetical protein